MPTATLVATVGGASSNTYATLAEAEQYYLNRWVGTSTVWSGESDANKNKALLFSAKLLDNLILWQGTVVDDTQSMLWPRYGLSFRNGYQIDSTTVPQDMKDAQSELARQLLVDVTRTDDSDVETQGITELKAGSVTLRFSEDQAIKMIPDLVALFIPRTWVEEIRGRAASSRPLVRGY